MKGNLGGGGINVGRGEADKNKMSNFVFTLPPPKNNYFAQPPLVYKVAMNTVKAILELNVLQ